MPVYDSESIANSKSKFECTYKTFTSNNQTATPDAPILVLDNLSVAFTNDCVGTFTNPYRKTAFTMQTPDGDVFSNILLIDSRFESLIRWLGENKIKVKLTGENTARGYAVYKIREIAYNNSQKLSSEDGFLQFMIERLLESSALSENISDDELDESGDSMKVTSLTSISDFLNCAGITLPENIRLWARRNLAVARSNEVTPEEKRHAQRALSIMLNIKWKSNYFEAIDPDEARRILDEELFGMERVKQRIIETIIQINRTHTLPAYGILLVGPAGTGKSQIAYLIAKILKLPWSTLDMSSINDAEQLTGSSRIYSNAKPGIIMWQANLTLYLLSMSLIKPHQATETATLPTCFSHSLIISDLQIITWNVSFLHQVYIRLPQQTTKTRLVPRFFHVLRLLTYPTIQGKKRKLYLSNTLFLRY